MLDAKQIGLLAVYIECALKAHPVVEHVDEFDNHHLVSSGDWETCLAELVDLDEDLPMYEDVEADLVDYLIIYLDEVPA